MIWSRGCPELPGKCIWVLRADGKRGRGFICRVDRDDTHRVPLKLHTGSAHDWFDRCILARASTTEKAAMCMSGDSAWDILFPSSSECTLGEGAQQSRFNHEILLRMVALQQMEIWRKGLDKLTRVMNTNRATCHQSVVLCCTIYMTEGRLQQDEPWLVFRPCHAVRLEIGLHYQNISLFKATCFAVFRALVQHNKKCGIWCEDLCLSMVTKRKKLQSECGPVKAGAKTSCEVWVG